METKEKRSFKGKKTISVVIGIAVVIAIASISYLYSVKNNSDDAHSQWIVSGPFAISKNKYKLGEDVFMTVNGLKPNEAGDILVVDPHDRIYQKIPFNGTMKDHFNTYFMPTTSKVSKLYTPEDLVGTWQVLFQGVAYKPLSFEVVNEWVPLSEHLIDTIPRPQDNSTK
ncbi:MAG: hypothetical protein ACT4N1_00655 [Nitrososphaerota archaeon]